MNRMSVSWLVGMAFVFVFAFLGNTLPRWLGLGPPFFWILRIVIWVLGLVAAVLVLLFLRARAKGQPKRDDEVDHAIDTAKKRLPQGTKLGKAPVLLVIGPASSAKTTIVQRSGIEPELLAGEVQRNEQVVPSLVNLWYASGNIVAEAGGQLLEDEARWARLLAKLQPNRVAAVFARGRQAPRVAVVCVSCEELAKPGAAQAAVTTAQTLRQRLVDAANRFGIRLPVYVLFTKADRLPYFTDFVRSFTRDESAAVLGATLPLAAPVDSGRYKEAESARVGNAFARMLHTLSLWRLEVLPRETTEDVRAGAYEFPRELGKLSSVATQFLVELCRPGQIGTSPFLRGFYVTGVRPIVVSDTPQVVAPPPVPGTGAVDATSVFDPRAMLAAAQQAAAAPAGSRRVPDWTFLPRLFKEIIFADRMAMAVTGGGKRVNLLRRVALAAASAVFLIFSIGFFTSWLSNRGLLRDARTGAAIVQGVDLTGTNPTATDLARLDTVRLTLSRLRAWDTTGAPLRYRWGLYSGDNVLPEVRSLYFHRFGAMLWRDTHGNLQTYLAGLPDTPTVTELYDTAFAALKSYLIITEHADRSTRDFLAPWLLQFWRAPRSADEQRVSLASAQFDVYADELRFGNPYNAPADAALVADARALLRQFGEGDRLYGALVNQVSREVPPVQYHRVVTGATDLIRNSYTVPGAFTKEGWALVQTSLENPDRFLAGDAWVLGTDPGSSAQARTLANDLRRRYEADYVRHWMEYLRASGVQVGGGARGASRAIERLGSNDSPLLHLLAIASRNTYVDTTVIGPAFAPVHQVSPPTVTDRLVVPENQPYIAALAGLATALQGLAEARTPAETQGAAPQAEGAERSVRDAVANLARAFPTQGNAQPVGQEVERLLNAPVSPVRGIVASAGAAGPNAAGDSFCRDAASVLAKYPFNRNAPETNAASMDEVNRVFKPENSAFTLLVQSIGELVVRIGNEYRPAPGAALQPRTQFLNMLNQIGRISAGLYPNNAQEPTVPFVITPQAGSFSSITLNIDGASHTVTPTDRRVGSFTWRLSQGRTAQVAGRIGEGQPTDLIVANGPWAIFELFGRAQWRSNAGGRHQLTWQVNPGGSFQAELSFPGGIPIFDPNVIAGISCVARVVQ